jgi:uncharacterized protein
MMLGMIPMSPYWLLMIPGLLLGIYAQIKLSSAYGRYSRVGSSRGVTGAQAARSILDGAGLYDVPVDMVHGHLTDHYDPTRRALFLSEENFQSTSLAAIGVAAHEAGHALQHQAAYAPLEWRMRLVPITSFASNGAYVIALLSMFMGVGTAMFSKLAGVAVILFGLITLFQMITLPVEFDASNRAKAQLARLGLVRGEEEAYGVSKVLNAAAMTYVAAMVSSVMELLHWFLLARAGDRD